MKKLLILLAFLSVLSLNAQTPSRHSGGVVLGDLIGTSGDPTGTKEGQIYWNDTLKKFRMYDGTSWSDLSATGADPTLQEVTDAGGTTDDNMSIENNSTRFFQVSNLANTIGTTMHSTGFMSVYDAGTTFEIDAPNDRITFKDIGTGFDLQLAFPSIAGSTKTLTFQDVTGTVALTSDISGTNSGTNTGDQTIQLTGDVTGSGTGSFVATLDKVAITTKTLATAVSSDHILISDVSDGGNLKKVLVSDLTGGVNNVTTALNISDNALVRGDGGSKGVQESGIIIDDSDNITGINNLAFSDNTGIIDSNGNQHITFKQVSSAINYIEITNSATGNKPEILTTGDDTNVGLTFKTKGDGFLRIETHLDLIHVATEVGHHGIEIDLDAAGFADNSGLQVDYTTGTIGAGETANAIEINIDESASTGGVIRGMSVSSTASGSSDVTAIHIEAGVNVIHQDSGTFGNVNSAVFTTSGGGEVSCTTAFNSTGIDVTMFTADNDYIIVTSASTFTDIEFTLATVASGGGITPTFLFSTGGSGFTQFIPTDETNQMKISGIIYWELSDISGTWATNSGGDYEIKIIRTANALSTAPIEDLVQITSALEYSWDKVGDLSVNNISVTGTVDGIDIATDVVANTAKVTNVTTNLSLGTITATTMDVNSSDGTNATLIETDTDKAGLLGADKWDEIVANTLKVSNVTHTGDVTGDTVLTIASGAVDLDMLSATATPTVSNFLRGDNTWAVPAGAGDMVLADVQTVTATKTFDTGSGANIISNNASASYGIQANNTSTGNGIVVDNTSTGNGIVVDNTSTGNGIFLDNLEEGVGIFIDNISAGTGIVVENVSTGKGIFIDNFSTGAGIVSNGSTVSSGYVYVGQNSGGNTFTVDKFGNVTANSFITEVNGLTIGIDVDVIAGGIGIDITTMGSGSGLRTRQTADGRGIFADTSADGISIYSQTISTGNSIVSNAGVAGTGYVYVGQNSGGNTFTVDKFGNVTANSFIKDGATNDDVLLGDGSTTSLAGIGGGTEIINEGNGNGLIITGRTAANYGNIGFNAVDFSFSDSAHSTRGATGNKSFASGSNTTASGLISLATGGATTASGDYSFSTGRNNESFSFAEFSIGSFGTLYTPVSPTIIDSQDRIFNVGNGISTGGGRNDAFTILKSGEIGIGINNFEANTTGELLQINGNIDITGDIVISGIVDGVDIAAEETRLANTSGTNTGDQTLASTSDATTHTVTLSDSGGSMQLVEGSNITLTTTGTGLDGIVTIASTEGANTSLSNLITTAINQNLIPASNDLYDLGSSALRWKDLWIDDTASVGDLLIKNTEADPTDNGFFTLNGVDVLVGTGGDKVNLTDLMLLTAKGDLFGYDSAKNIRIPVGNNNTVLTADASSSSGVKWSGIDTSQITSGILGGIRGGTGISSYSAGDVVYASADGSALTKLSIGGSSTFLGVSGGLPTWETVDLGILSDVVLTSSTSGNVLTFNGSSWVNQAPSSSGEINLGNNVGSGSGTIFRDKTGVTLNFKSLIAGSNITITNNTDDITIASTGSGGFSGNLSDLNIDANLLMENFNIDLDGNKLILDTDGDTAIHAKVDDIIVLDTNNVTTAQFSQTEISFFTSLEMNSQVIKNLIDPTNPQDAATKKYVDDNIGGNITIKVSLLPAQILALNTTPIEAIPAPGVGKVISIKSMFAKLTFNTIVYTENSGISLVYNGETVQIIVVSVLDSTADRIVIGQHTTSTWVEVEENTAIDFYTPVLNPQLGNSSVDVYITYEIITL